MEKILITGAAGQLGSELTQSLAKVYGSEAIIATDLNQAERYKFDYCRFEVLDVMDRERLRSLVSTPGGMPPDAFGAYVREEAARYGKIIRAAGMRID